MGKWIALIVIIISGSILAYVYYELERTTSDTATTAVTANVNTIRVFHSFQDGVHRYTGEVKLPHSCFSLDTQLALDKDKENTVLLALKSTDRMLDQRLCAQIPTGYSFDAMIEAPEGVDMIMMLDGKELSTRIVKTAWESAAGTVVNVPDVGVH